MRAAVKKAPAKKRKAAPKKKGSLLATGLITPLLTELFKIAVDKGLPAVVRLLEEWDMDRDPTGAEIRQRANALPPPGEY